MERQVYKQDYGQDKRHMPCINKSKGLFPPRGVGLVQVASNDEPAWRALVLTS